MSGKLRMGMIGGGKDAFIGAVHRIALNMDGLMNGKLHGEISYFLVVIIINYIGHLKIFETHKKLIFVEAIKVFIK